MFLLVEARKNAAGPRKMFEMLGAILNNTLDMQQKMGRGTGENLEEDAPDVELPIPVATMADFDELEACMADSSARKKLVFSFQIYYPI
jgi:hypothetical protein